MSLVESIKNLFKTPEELILYRLRSAKLFFIISTFCFFINYLFLGAGFFSNISALTLTYTYTSLVLSYVLYTSFLILYYIRGKLTLMAYGLIGCVVCIGVCFLLPVIGGSTINNLLSF